MAWRSGVVTRTSVDSSNRVVTRGLFLLAIAWELLWVLSDSRLWVTRQGTWWATLAVAAVMVSWVGLVSGFALRSRSLSAYFAIVNVLCLIAAGTAMSAAMALGEGAAWADGAYFDMAAGAAGLMLRTRKAMVLAGVAIALELLFVITRDIAGGVDRVEALDLLYPLLAVAIAASAIGARRVLLDIAARADRAARDSAEADISRARAILVAEEVSDRQRLLHETVLNTLVALQRGGLSSSDDGRRRLADKCRESSEVLKSFSHRQPVDGNAEGSPLGGLLADALALGVVVRVDLGVLDEVPSRVRQALLAAVREALANALRHSSCTVVEIQGSVSRRGLFTVTVLDDGHGFVPDGVAPGYGISRVICDGLESAGGSARIDSAPGDGTCVHLEWRQGVRSQPGLLDTAAFVVPLLAAFVGYCLVALIITWPIVDGPVQALAAVSIYLATAAALAWASRRGWLTWPWVVSALVLGASVYLFQSLSMSAAPPDVQLDWGSAAMVSLFIVISGIGPRFAWIPVIATWLLVQGDPVSELLSAGTAVLIAGSLFGRAVRRMSVQVERSRQQSMEARGEEQAAQLVTEQVRRRYSAMDPTAAMDLLDSIALGVAQPEDESVRAAAAREERYLRAAMRIDPTMGELPALVARFLQMAHSRAADLEVDLVDVDGLSLAQADVDLPSWVDVLDAVPAGSTSRVTSRCEGDRVVVRLVARIDRRRYADMRSLGGIDTEPGESGRPEMMWEAAFEHGHLT